MMKRRGTARAPESPGRNQKRQRVSATEGPDTEAQKTTQDGLQLLGDIKRAKDREGRHIADDFRELPDRGQYPDYYTEIGRPISLDEIEGRLQKYEYPRMTLLESDLLLMVRNAQYYNQEGSVIYRDAQRIRKMVASAMRKINPEYLTNPDYVPKPTPVPEDDEQRIDRAEEARAAADAEVVPGPRRRQSTVALQTDTEGEADDTFVGKSFTEAQEKIIKDLMAMKVEGEENEPLFGAFFDKPPKKEIPEYYMFIEHPVSLRMILKMVRGTHSKEAQRNNVFKTWEEFEKEANYLWTNARRFNEEGSEIWQLAGRLENEFVQLLSEAKSVVAEPEDSAQEPSTSTAESSGPRLVLKPPKTPEMPPAQQKLKLKFPTRQSTEKHEFSVDKESLRKQQELVRAGSNGMELPGQTPSRNLRSRSGSGLRPRTTSSAGRSTQDREIPPNVPTPSPAQQTVKPEAAVRTPDLSTITPQNQTYEPHGPAPPPSIPHNLTPANAPRPLKPWEIYNAQKGRIERDLRRALIHNVTISTPPGPQERKLVFPAMPDIRPQQNAICLLSGPDTLSFVVTVANSTLERQTLLSISVDDNKRVITSVPTPIPSTDRSLQRFDIPVGRRATGRSAHTIVLEMIAAEGRGLQHLSALDSNKVQVDRFIFHVQFMGN